MSSIPQVSEAMRYVLSERATALERESGLVQRSSARLNGAILAQSLVFGFLANPEASYSQLRHVAASLGVQVSRQAIEQRMGQASVVFLRQLLEEATGQVIESEGRMPELLSRFQGVYLQDGTKISLPSSLAKAWPGNSRENSPSPKGCMQVQVRLEVAQGRWTGLWLQHGREHEATGAPVETPLPEGALWVVDSGYRNLAALRRLGQTNRFWIMPPHANLVVRDDHGVSRSLTELLQHQTRDVVDLDVQAGLQERLPVRLIAVRVPAAQAERRRQGATGEISLPPKGVQRPNARKHSALTQAGTRDMHAASSHKKRHTSNARLRLMDWTIILTNVPRTKLSVTEVLVLYRCRWQMELLWKLSKEIGHVDTWRSEKPERILTEILAKWLGLLLSHWVMLIECWQDPRHSTVKAHQAIQWMAPVLAISLAGLLDVERAVAWSAALMSRGCQIDPRPKRPATFQLLDHPDWIRP